LIASAIFFSHQDDGLSLHEVLVTLFLFITAPVGEHLMAKAALHLRLQSLAKLPENGLLDGESCDKEISSTAVEDSGKTS
jgi:multicomponent K+:H+ antiporter subunit G